MTDRKPLVLDVDGTFLRTDMLYELFWAGLGQAPGQVLAVTLGNLTRPAELKAKLSEIVALRTDLLPVHAGIATEAMTALEEGGEVVLASASHESLVARLAADYGLSERVFASDGVVNLKGAAKAQALVAAFGEGGFDYAGDHGADRAVWARADRALVVGNGAIARTMSRAGKSVGEFEGGWRKRDLMRALRPHQWVKNLLLLLPVIAAHHFDAATLLLVLTGIVSFCSAASSIYVVNDLLDLEADRLHATKRHRPFASGAVPIRVGMATALALALAALGLGALLGWPFLGIVALYMTTSLAYSLKLKRMRWIDIATLAGLYTIRVVAGAAASQVDVSGYLLVFVYPVFLSLGCVKRLTELTLATSDERLPGRGYGRPDRGDLLNVAVLGIFGALLSFFLYSFTEQAERLYPTQWLLWVAMVPVGAWLIRMVWLGYTGKQDYDPIVFALKDKLGIGLLLIALALLFYAAGLWQAWFGF